MVVTVKHKEGRHFATLWSVLQIAYISLFKKGKPIYIYFDDNSKYNLESNDQYDWCKVVGRAQGGWKNGIWKTEQMVVWRYIKETNEFHVADNYFREDYKMFLPRKWEVVKDEGFVKVSTDKLWSLLPVGAYFGGNMPAPRDLTYKIKV